MRNPDALTDEILDKIEELLRAFDSALENILYKTYNPIPKQKDISTVLDAIDDARHGETLAEWQENCEAQNGGE